MRIGYPCINNSIGCTTNSTFRLSNYSEENLIIKVKSNLSCLKKILEFNIKNNFLFFRIGSGLVPFASHPICRFNWESHFKGEFADIGAFFMIAVIICPIGFLFGAIACMILFWKKALNTNKKVTG